MNRIKSIIVLILSIFTISTVIAQNNNDNAAAIQLVTKNAAAIGLSTDQLKNYKVSSTYYDQTGGVRMVYLLQTYKSLPVYNQMLVLAFKGEKLVSNAGSFLDNMESKSNFQSPAASVTATDAVRTAITESKLAMPVTISMMNIVESNKKLDFGKMNIARENITAELMWVPIRTGIETTIKLAWEIQIAPLKQADFWNIRVDAVANKFIEKSNYTVFDELRSANGDLPGSGYQRQFLKPTPPIDLTNKMFSLKENSPSLVGTVNYLVIPYPAESPIHPGGTAAVRTNPWTLAGGNAVTLGWHNNGTLDFITSRGNNVHAHEDQAANNSNAGIMATSTTSPDPLNFNFPPNYAVAPTTALFQQFALTNLFYWNNINHDATYNYGFDEPSGNFQNSNLGRGGLGNDYVQADGQDGGGTNNANFATPPDGGQPRMQMFLWSPTRSVTTMTVNAPPVIAGPYTAVEGAFSTANLLQNVGPITNKQVVYYNDNAAATHEACVVPSNGGALAGKIALINRGNCTFVIKVKNAQDAGAVAVIMVNNVPGAPIVMGGADNTIIIPAVMISDVDGATIAGQLANNVFVTLSGTAAGTIQLDGDIDNGIVCHEFFHGVSNRLTGGPSNTSCLGNAEEGGEGWSDYNALMLTTDWSTALITDGVTKPRPMGNYAFGYPVTGPGIRSMPYCTDIAINSKVYLATLPAEVHDLGEVWCEVLWEMTWGLIQTNGISANMFNASGPN